MELFYQCRTNCLLMDQRSSHNKTIHLKPTFGGLLTSFKSTPLFFFTFPQQNVGFSTKRISPNLPVSPVTTLALSVKPRHYNPLLISLRFNLPFSSPAKTDALLELPHVCEGEQKRGGLTGRDVKPQCIFTSQGGCFPQRHVLAHIL